MDAHLDCIVIFDIHQVEFIQEIHIYLIVKRGVQALTLKIGTNGWLHFFRGKIVLRAENGLKSYTTHKVYCYMGCWWCKIHLYGYYRDYNNQIRYVSEEPFEVPLFDFPNKESIARITRVRYPDAVDCRNVQVFYYGHDEYR